VIWSIPSVVSDRTHDCSVFVSSDQFLHFSSVEVRFGAIIISWGFIYNP
jgi:hypothetical protein